MTSPTMHPPLVSRSLRWRSFVAEARYELIASCRQLDFALPSVIFPAMFYLLFGVVFGSNSGLSSYLVPTYGTFGVIGTALFSFGVGVAVARESGEMRLKQVTPLSPLALIAAKMTTSLWFSCLVLLEIFVLAAIFGGVRFERSAWLGLTCVLLLGTIPFAAIGLAIGTHVSGKGAPAVINLIYLSTAFLSGLWIPIDMLPGVLQSAAVFMPPYHLAQLALKMIGEDAGQPWLLHIGALCGLTVLGLVMAARGLRR